MYSQDEARRSPFQDPDALLAAKVAPRPAGPIEFRDPAREIG